MTRNGILSAALGALVLGAGCGPKQAEVRPDQPGAAAEAEPGKTSAPSIRIEKRGEEKVVVFDLNHDGKPDVWTYTVAAKTADGKDYDKLVRKELDVNFDGKVDITKFYDDKEQVEHESFDLDFDGKVDQTNFYEKGVIVRKERYLDSSNGKPQLWIYFEKGKIARKERDTNGDGKVDYWEYWENDQVDRIGEDLDGDGNVDRWTKSPDSTASGG